MIEPLVGMLWTGAIIAALVQGKDGPLSSRWVCLACALLLVVVVQVVVRGIGEVEAVAGGLKILDTRYPYSVSDLLAFAEVLGPQGRALYAAFQLGIDTWAPPAFAGLVASAACVTLPKRWATATLILVGGYLVVAVLANALMPVVMLNYPRLESAGLQFLLHILPWLDFVKYSLHILAWAIILVHPFYRYTQRKQQGAPNL